MAAARLELGSHPRLPYLYYACAYCQEVLNLSGCFLIYGHANSARYARALLISFEELHQGIDMFRLPWVRVLTLENISPGKTKTSFALPRYKQIPSCTKIELN